MPRFNVCPTNDITRFRVMDRQTGRTVIADAMRWQADLASWILNTGLTTADRERAWDWDPAWGEPLQPDQHVREFLKRDDGAVALMLAEEMNAQGHAPERFGDDR